MDRVFAVGGGTLLFFRRTAARGSDRGKNMRSPAKIKQEIPIGYQPIIQNPKVE